MITVEYDMSYKDDVTFYEHRMPDFECQLIRICICFSVFRCTLNAIPNTQSLLNKARLPLGILIHPFKDLAVSKMLLSCRLQLLF